MKLAAAAAMSEADFLDQAVTSLFAQLQTVRKQYDLPKSSTVIVPMLIQMILLRNAGTMSQEDFERQMQEVVWHRNHCEWTPPEDFDEQINKELELQKEKRDK